MLRTFAGALALVFLSLPAHAASGPLVTGKCWCAIGWGVHITNCGRRTCSKTACAAACAATLPKKSAGLELTDLSASRRHYARRWHARPRPYVRHVAIRSVARAHRRAATWHTPAPIRAVQAVAGTLVGGIASVLRGNSTAGVDSRLVDIMNNAAKVLPEGYSARVTSGYRRHDGPHDGHAIDLEIVTPAGVALSNRGPDSSGLYERLARAGYGYVLSRYPGLKGRFAWGGSFETRAGSGVADIMHYDLMGDRGNHFHPRLAALGPIPLSADEQIAGRPRFTEPPARRYARVRHHVRVRYVAHRVGRHRRWGRA